MWLTIFNFDVHSNNTNNNNNIPYTTATAAQYHSTCVYYQVHELIGKLNLNPKEWGWLRIEGHLRPQTTHLPIDPQAVLKIIVCTCNCKTNCSTKICTCKKTWFGQYCRVWWLQGNKLYKLSYNSRWHSRWWIKNTASVNFKSKW